jgi:hypothetical protein
MNNEELRQRYNPDGSQLRRHQMRMLDILIEVDRICKKHHISYWLSSGTLIGALRHNGFIPWDDDLDIEMMRSDYLRLMEVLPQELPEWLALQSDKTDPAYFYFGYNSKYDPESADYDEEAAQGKLPYNFYKVKSKNAVISPYRCYFYATGTNSLVNLSMMNMTDGIGEVMDEVVVRRPVMGVYNLKGQKLRGINTMEGLPAGIYIVNGKKLVVK